MSQGVSQSVSQRVSQRVKQRVSQRVNQIVTSEIVLTGWRLAKQCNTSTINCKGSSNVMITVAIQSRSMAPEIGTSLDQNQAGAPRSEAYAICEHLLDIMTKKIHTHTHLVGSAHIQPC